jgi:predicted dehydrogenase
MKTYKVGIIGCGMISNNHFKALKNVENAEVKTICDIKPDRLEKAKEQYGIEKCYSDYHELLKDPEIDTVHICLPHYLHAKVAIDAMKAGKDVLCEKPMALHPEEAEEMLRVRDETARQLGICFQNRYNEAVKYMKSLIDSGKLGKVLGGRGIVTWDRKEPYYRDSDWRGTLDKEGGSALENQAIHTFDLLQWLGGPIRTVEATTAIHRLKGVIETEDTAEIYMTGFEGERYIFFTSNAYVRNAPVFLELAFENGILSMNGNLVTVEQDGKKETKDFTSGIVLGKDYWGSGHGYLIEDFYKRLAAGERVPIEPEEAIVSVRLLDAVYTSAREKRVLTNTGNDQKGGAFV